MLRESVSGCESTPGICNMEFEMHDNQNHRNGLTLLEVIVVIFCIIVILALLLPNMRTAGGAARRTRCLNNMRNVSVAVHGFASSNKGRLPAQAYYPSSSNADSETQEIYEGHSWVVPLLPYLDHMDLYDRWDDNKPWDSTVENVDGTSSNASLADLALSQLTCPEDSSAFRLKGGLSYAVNCGIGDTSWHTKSGLRKAGRVPSGQHYMVEPFDWNNNGILPPEDQEDAAVTRDFTLFSPKIGHRHSAESDAEISSSHSLDKIYDGTSNTIMLGENINAGARPGRSKLSWSDPQVCSNGLILPINAKRLKADSHASDGTLAASIVTQPINPGVNKAKAAGNGTAPFVNSNHPGLAVVAFVDGAAMTLSEDIDMGVYSRLLTPCGTRQRKMIDFVPEERMTPDSF